MSVERPRPDRRRRDARRTRGALSRAAVQLVLERGLHDVSVEDIAERADVDRRTFSRHFAGKEDAVLDGIRADMDRINAALRARPAHEPPLVAFRAAVFDWLADDEPAWHRRPEMLGLMSLAEREPTLYAAAQHIQVEAQEDSVRIVAERLGVDPDDLNHDLRPAIVVAVGAGALVAAETAWARGGGAESLPDLVGRAFDTLTRELPIVAPGTAERTEHP